MSKNQNNLQLALPNVPDDVMTTLKIAQQRFCFNIRLIEEKYSKKSSGIVYNTNSDKFEFDENLCTLTDDESLTRAVDGQKKALFGTEFGSSILSSPSVAPEDSPRDELRIRKINKLFLALNDSKPYTRSSPLSSLPSSSSVKVLPARRLNVNKFSSFSALPSTSDVQKPERRFSLRLSNKANQLAICSSENATPQLLPKRRPRANKSEVNLAVTKFDESDLDNIFDLLFKNGDLSRMEDSWQKLQNECARTTRK